MEFSAVSLDVERESFSLNWIHVSFSIIFMVPYKFLVRDGAVNGICIIVNYTLELKVSSVVQVFANYIIIYFKTANIGLAGSGELLNIKGCERVYTRTITLQLNLINFSSVSHTCTLHQSAE